MPLSNELILGFRPRDLGPLCARYNDGFKPTAEALAEAMYRDLKEIHRELLSRHFGAPAQEDAYGICFEMPTPAGVRSFAIFHAEGYIGKAYEVWYAPESSFFGVRLVSRYSPTWLDWRDEHGTDGCFIIDADLLAMVDEARTAIAGRIPEFAQAGIAVEPVFY
jgi:hypothetical protein